MAEKASSVTIYVTADGDLNRRFGSVLDTSAADPDGLREHVAEALELAAKYVRDGHADDDLGLANDVGAIRGRMADHVREAAPELDTDGPIVGPLLDAAAKDVADLSREVRDGR